ncbi:hypothetical protein PENSPDRAFT_757415 [Peniophora sp. CONT]|nr:hypothetical protein PENSPDRAFT_757415 [Peniophora sp. CONT]
MSDDPRFSANWDPTLQVDPAQATEVNEAMYTQTHLPNQFYGGYQLGTGGTLGALYGQNFENQSLPPTSAPTPMQGVLAPAYPTPAYHRGH